MAALAAGATLQLMPRLDVGALVRAIAAGEITHLSLVPTAYQRLCDYLESREASVQPSGLPYISAGGAPLDPTLKQRVERLLGLRLVNGYGMTECAPGSRTRPDRDAPANCIGWPEAGVEMRVDGDDTGELLLRSATRMIGYFGAPGETAAMLRPDGWLATGDLARRLPDGSFELVGRKKEMIIRSGFNVYPAEVEAVLNSLPAVSQSAVLGRRLDDSNEEVVAFVRLHDPGSTDAATIAREAGKSLAPYKRPSRIVLVDEFPLGPTGKILKHRLGAGLSS
jgi:long-chain acyl-CoA synthetase